MKSKSSTSISAPTACSSRSRCDRSLSPEKTHSTSAPESAADRLPGGPLRPGGSRTGGLPVPLSRTVVAILGPIVNSMDRNTALGEFLRSRRARITPRQAGLSDDGSSRRVPGLRREEIAQLAGVSVDYYVRLERGRRTSPRPCWTPPPARYASIPSNAPICSSSPSPPQAGPAARRRVRSRSARGCATCSGSSSTPPPLCWGGDWTYLRPTRWHVRCSPTSTRCRTASGTWCGSCSATRPLAVYHLGHPRPGHCRLAPARRRTPSPRSTAGRTRRRALDHG